MGRRRWVRPSRQRLHRLRGLNGLRETAARFSRLVLDAVCNYI